MSWGRVDTSVAKRFGVVTLARYEVGAFRRGRIDVTRLLSFVSCSALDSETVAPAPTVFYKAGLRVMCVSRRERELVSWYLSHGVTGLELERIVSRGLAGRLPSFLGFSRSAVGEGVQGDSVGWESAPLADLISGAGLRRDPSRLDTMILGGGTATLRQVPGLGPCGGKVRPSRSICM